MTVGAMPGAMADNAPTEPISPVARAAAARRAVRRLRGRLARLESKVDSLRLWIRVAIALGLGDRVWEHHAQVKSFLASLLGGG